MTFHAPDPLAPLAARTKTTADIFEAGERTGKFRGGEDDLITDAQGNSRISFEDYAIALVDELETPQHRRCRFTIGY